VCWAAYILLTQRVGDAVSGLGGLAISMPVAGLVATLVAGPGVVDHLTPELLVHGLGLAILLPVVPFTLELLALRRLTAGAFGTLMALEPAFALIIGFVALSQVPNGLAVAGIGLVVAAGIGAERSGSRHEGQIDTVGLEDRAPVADVPGGTDELEARGRDEDPVGGRGVLAEDRVDQVGVRLQQ
jgi:inner membrane transporter RhtA